MGEQLSAECVQEAAPFSMPVLSMHEANWDDDEAHVGYRFHRPADTHTGKLAQPTPPAPQYANKSWLSGDRTALEQVRFVSACLALFSTQLQ